MEIGSDFNGDGYSDLAANTTNGEGIDSVVILYGSEDGLTEVGLQRIVAADFGDPLSDDSSQPFGSVLASGDFDGDRYADLALGISSARIGRVAQAGAVRVIYR